MDVLPHILVHLPVQTVLVLRQTSKTLCAFTHLRSSWLLLFRTHVLDQHIPYPNIDIADLSAGDLESLTRRALSLRRIWTSPEPVPRRHVTMPCPEPNTRLLFLQFLPGRSNRWLISVRMTARPRSYLLQCWDLASDRPTSVADLTHADGPYGGVVLNSDPTSPAVLALQSAQTETFSIDFDADDPESAFQTEATIDGIRELHLLVGNTLVTRTLDDGGGALSLWDLADLRQEKLQLLNPSIVQPDDRVQAIHLAHDYALVVRVQSIEIYTTSPCPSLLSSRGPPIAYPLAQFKFQWRTDTVVLCEQHASPSDLSPRPIHFFVRFGSICPWPVNVLHHYLLLPNPAYHTCGIRPHTSPTPPTRSRSTASSSHSFLSARTSQTTEYNLPYDPRLHMVDTIGSPVRSFGRAAMALGRYGTALWLDNHTEERLQPSEHGQRLAGRVVWVGDVPPMVDVDPIAAASSGASMVFGTRSDDAWTRIAMEEEAGRIALGHVDGAITLLEY